MGVNDHIFLKVVSQVVSLISRILASFVERKLCGSGDASGKYLIEEHNRSLCGRLSIQTFLSLELLCQEQTTDKRNLWRMNEIENSEVNNREFLGSRT